MPEAYHEIWVLENGPLGANLADFLVMEMLGRDIEAEIIPPDFHQELLGINSRTSTDEQIQAAFLSNRDMPLLGGLIVAILHVNSQASLGYVAQIADSGVKVLARLPSENDARRDVEVGTVRDVLSSKNIPSAEYSKLGIRGYREWAADHLVKLLHE